MLSKKEIKDIQSLSHKKFRDALNLFVAEGPKIVTELIQLIPQQIEEVYALKEWIASNESLSQKVNVVEVDAAELERLSQLQTPNQVIAVIRKLPSAKPVGESFTLYLDTIQDPGNFGTIIRIADWFGIKNMVCTGGCADLYNPKVVQSTMASIARVNVYYDEEEEWLKDQQAPIFAATIYNRTYDPVPKIGSKVPYVGAAGMERKCTHIIKHQLKLYRQDQLFQGTGL